MRTKFMQAALLVSAVLLAATLASGADFLVTTVAASNGTSAVSSSLTSPLQYSIQCTQAARYRVCPTSSCTATSQDFTVPTSGMDIPLTTDGNSPAAAVHYVAVYADGADTVCSLFKVVPPTMPGF